MKKTKSLSAASQRRKRRGVSRLVWTTATFGMAVLLFAVACLQYRWNMQIRRAMEVRVGSDLESVMMKWHLNLYREFSTICIALQVGPDSGAEDHWIDYLRRYEGWRGAASSTGSVENLYSNPDVVSKIYIYETSRRSEERLFVLDPDADRIEAISKPAELQGLLLRLQQRSTSLPIALRAWERDNQAQSQMPDSESSPVHNSGTKAITGWQFEETIPAIVHPVLHRTGNFARATDPVDWLVVVLNPDTIKHRIFPELAHRYFENKQGLEYRIAVVSTGNTSHLLYSSDPGFGLPDMSGSDSVMKIFGPPPESTEGSFWQVVNDRESLHGEEWHRFSGPVWFPVFRHGPEARDWILFLKLRTGSMEASITKIWEANVFVGAVVLVLLGGSLLLVLVATKRERTLAAMQMDFVTSISHELRTPLSGVFAAAQNIRDGFALDLPHYGALMTAQIRQLIELVDQILLFAVLSNGKKKYQLTPMTIDQVLDSLRKTTFAVLATSGFTIDVQVGQNLPCILGDKQGLLRCLQNLIDNAAKYSGKSRWIGIWVQLEDPGQPEAGIKITVSDQGVGIEPSELEQIFDPFYRGSHAIESQIHGSGLGLSVVKQIVDEMHGRLSVTSKVGRGTHVVLHLQSAENRSSPNTNERREALTCQ